MSDIKIPDLNIPTPQNSDAPTSKTVAQEEAENQAALEAELEAEYIDKRQIIIASVLNYSAYRRINMAALGKPRNTIGSSVNSVRKLMSN